MKRSTGRVWFTDPFALFAHGAVGLLSMLK